MQFTAAAFRWVNDLSAHGILITDADLRIRGWNNWLESATGHRAETIIGQNLLEAFPDLVKRGLDQYYKDALAGQVRVISQRLHGYILPLPSATEDGSFAYMQQSARIAPLNEGGRVIGTITVIEDVTERIARENELVRLLGREKDARAEAEAANRAKDEFLATVSHELRTPLNSILGWVQILRTHNLDSNGLERGLEAVERSARAQTALIEDILDASRIITGKLNLNVRPVDIVSVIEQALDIVKPAAEAKAIELNATLRSPDGLVSGDPNRLQQLVWNLLSNAIKFTPKKGRVDVRLEQIDSEVELVVKDTGQGIDTAFLPHVFDRFRQANSTTTRQHGGLGLGLAIVRHLVEMHGGTVQAESDGPGLGATFTVRLPFMVAGKAKDSLRSENPRLAALSGGKTIDEDALVAALNGVRVLVVDDEADAREMLDLMLTHRGVDIRTAGSVNEALTTLEAWKPDVLVSDIGMPREDGYSLIGKVRALASESGQIPAVALTGYAGKEDCRRLLSAGYQICVAKPVDIAELCLVLASLVHR